MDSNQEEMSSISPPPAESVPEEYPHVYEPMESSLEQQTGSTSTESESVADISNEETPARSPETDETVPKTAVTVDNEAVLIEDSSDDDITVIAAGKVEGGLTGTRDNSGEKDKRKRKRMQKKRREIGSSPAEESDLPGDASEWRLSPRPRRAAAEKGAERLTEASKRVSIEESDEEDEEGLDTSDSDEGWIDEEEVEKEKARILKLAKELTEEAAAHASSASTGDTTRSCSPEDATRRYNPSFYSHPASFQQLQTNQQVTGQYLYPFDQQHYQAFYSMENMNSYYPYYPAVPSAPVPGSGIPQFSQQSFQNFHSSKPQGTASHGKSQDGTNASAGAKRKTTATGNNATEDQASPTKRPKNRPPSLPASLLSAGATGHYPHFIPTPRGLSTNPPFPALTSESILASVKPSASGTSNTRTNSGGSSESKFKRREIAEMLAFLTQTICWKDVAAAVGNKRRTPNSYASHWRNVLVKNVVERYPE